MDTTTANDADLELERAIYHSGMTIYHTPFVVASLLSWLLEGE